MNHIGMLSCFCLTAAVAVSAEPSVAQPPQSDNSRAEQDVKPLDHETAPLPDFPPVRFNWLFKLEGEEGRGLQILAFSPDGKILAASRSATREHNHDVTLWDVGRRKLLNVLPHTDNIEHTIRALAFVPPGDRLVTGCGNLNKVFLWDVQTGKLLDTLDTGGRPTFGVTGLAAFPDGKRVLICVTSGLTLWDLSAKTSKTLPMDEHVPLAPGDYPRVPRHCYSVAFTADGSRFATSVNAVYFAPRILLWDAKGCRVTGAIPVPRLGWDFAYAPDGSSLAALYYDLVAQRQAVGVWDATTAKKLLDGTVYDWHTFGVTYTRGGRYLLVAGAHRSPMTRAEAAIGVWEVATGKLVNRLPLRALPPLHLTLSSDNKLLAVPGRDINVYAIQYTTQRKVSADAPSARKP